MENRISEEIRTFVRESTANRFPGSTEPYFDEPLIGFVAADDSLFQEYKRIIGQFHRTPAEILTGAATVISWVLPISRSTRESNRQQSARPSLEWAQTRSFGDEFIMELRRHLVSWLGQQGYAAVAPQLAPNWQRLNDTPVGLASTWSERHAAYAAGLGTFSLNDALISPRGIAHRLGSVVTTLALPPTVGTRPGYRDNCLYYRDGSCMACVKRCPTGAISAAGHDKKRCDAYLYTVLTKELAEEYGTPIPGCGLCQTKVPCEAAIPKGKGG
jgi:epoxyqueuosine reductase QueG